MAYNNAFPMGYQYMAPQPQQYAAPQQTQQQSGGMIWVSGEAGAKAYLVAPNSTVQLWDSESQTIYLKSADGSGMPTMKILDYTIREQAQTGQNMPTLMQDSTPQYVTKEEFNEFTGRIQRQIDKISNRNNNGKREDRNNGKSDF